MLTPQEVSARSFTKTMMGGYNMTMVDEFLDELTDDYTSLYKENASLKAKMKVLVEKVEEYRATEDSMRATLLTAQRMADSIIKEAEEKRDGILQQAEAAAREKLDGYRKEAEQYSKRLQQGQEEIRQSPEVGEAMLALKDFMFESVYTNQLAKGEEGKAQDMLRRLFEYYQKDPDRLPGDFQTIRMEEGVDRAVCDYIAGMTDPFAADRFKELFIPKGWTVL